MERLLAKLRCNLWFWLGLFADRVLVQPIPNTVWRLQMPGANLYQFAMRHSFALSERYGFDYWLPDSASQVTANEHPEKGG